ncbi:hypothetical protein AB0I68_10225 [Streptomyces sp. NPDC050448]|uniref:hypothetical protein n=1 Tax=Streptomyces sp. NPDC050448 TaxID=3155404 RepID=UPI003440E6D2
MATQKALEGAMRWTRGTVIALCAALAVLVHHETAAIAVTSVAATHPGHTMPDMGSSSAGTMPMSSAAEHTNMLGASLSAHSARHGTCADPGMQHCATASAETVKLPAPPQEPAAVPANPHQTNARPVSATAIGRAPPDLSVLSQLRI